MRTNDKEKPRPPIFIEGRGLHPINTHPINTHPIKPNNPTTRQGDHPISLTSMRLAGTHSRITCRPNRIQSFTKPRNLTRWFTPPSPADSELSLTTFCSFPVTRLPEWERPLALRAPAIEAGPRELLQLSHEVGAHLAECLSVHRRASSAQHIDLRRLNLLKRAFRARRGVSRQKHCAVQSQVSVESRVMRPSIHSRPS